MPRIQKLQEILLRRKRSIATLTEDKLNADLFARMDELKVPTQARLKVIDLAADLILIRLFGGDC